jgi:hypothetical protein
LTFEAFEQSEEGAWKLRAGLERSQLWFAIASLIASLLGIYLFISILRRSNAMAMRPNSRLLGTCD